jgi:hypothetical protein
MTNALFAPAAMMQVPQRQRQCSLCGGLRHASTRSRVELAGGRHWWPWLGGVAVGSSGAARGGHGTCANWAHPRHICAGTGRPHATQGKPVVWSAACTTSTHEGRTAPPGRRAFAVARAREAPPAGIGRAVALGFLPLVPLAVAVLQPFLHLRAQLWRARRAAGARGAARPGLAAHHSA